MLELSGCGLNLTNKGALNNSGGTGQDGPGAAALSALSCGNASMTGAAADSCTVTLNAAAPSGGLTVNLSTNSSAVAVPGTVTVPADATSAGFSATASSVATAQTVTLTATAGSVSENFDLHLSADAPTLSVETSGSPSTYGSPVTFTATIASGATGSVTFYDGGVSLGTGTINGPTALITISSLTTGSHTITTSWPGNTSYGASTSDAITQLVNKASPAIAWAAPSAINYGTALSATQLDATSPVAGTFAYSPAIGSILAAGSQTLSVIFAPADSIDYTVASATVPLTVNQGTSSLSVNASSVSFGNVPLNLPATQTVVLTSTGTASVTVNSVATAGTGFTMSSPTLPAILTSGQTATLEVQFDPTLPGAAIGTLTITSTSNGGATTLVPLTGTGVAVNYAVDLSWDAPASSADPIAGYNVYRSPSGSATYQLLNSQVDARTTYTDSSVQNGQTYDYVVESVDYYGVESVPSSPIAVTIP